MVWGRVSVEVRQQINDLSDDLGIPRSRVVAALLETALADLSKVQFPRRSSGDQRGVATDEGLVTTARRSPEGPPRRVAAGGSPNPRRRFVLRLLAGASSPPARKGARFRVPKITPALPTAHPTHADRPAEFAAGWCVPCYEAGSFTLTTRLSDDVCLLHGALSDPPSASGAAWTPTPQPVPASPRRHSPRPRGTAARQPGRLGGARSRPRTARRAVDRQQARARAYGRRRAAARLTTGGYTPHPGWRHFIAPGWRVLTDQAEALAVVDALVDDQDWRDDKRAAWAAILRQLVCAMDWDTGLVVALTAQRLGAAGARAPRTVSRVIAWARAIGLVVVVEHGASAEFLGTDRGRTPTYALVTNTPLPMADAASGPDESGQLTLVVDESGDLPASSVEIKPLNGRRLEPTAPAEPDWPLYRVPETAPERGAAARRLLARLGLDPSGVPRCRCGEPGPCSDPGGTPAPVLPRCSGPSTITPTDPTITAATRSAEPATRSVSSAVGSDRGVDRLGDLPAQVVGARGDYVAAQHDRLRAPALPHRDTLQLRRPSAAQRSAQEALRVHLAQLRARRRTSGGSFSDR